VVTVQHGKARPLVLTVHPDTPVGRRAAVVVAVDGARQS
jgi:hypothetical protein